MWKWGKERQMKALGLERKKIEGNREIIFHAFRRPQKGKKKTQNLIVRIGLCCSQNKIIKVRYTHIHIHLRSSGG